MAEFSQQNDSHIHCNKEIILYVSQVLFHGRTTIFVKPLLRAATCEKGSDLNRKIFSFFFPKKKMHTEYKGIRSKNNNLQEAIVVVSLAREDRNCKVYHLNLWPL